MTESCTCGARRVRHHIKPDCPYYQPSTRPLGKFDPLNANQFQFELSPSMLAGVSKRKFTVRMTLKNIQLFTTGSSLQIGVYGTSLPLAIPNVEGIPNIPTSEDVSSILKNYEDQRVWGRCDITATQWVLKSSLQGVGELTSFFDRGYWIGLGTTLTKYQITRLHEAEMELDY